MKMPQVSAQIAKEDLKKIITALLPELFEVYDSIKTASHWTRLYENFRNLLKQYNIQNYVDVYVDERRIYSAIMRGLFSQGELAQVEQEIQAGTAEKGSSYYSGVVAELFEGGPGSDVGDEPAAQLTPEQQQLILGGFIPLFFNLVSVMTHGEMLTSLVPKALAGDEEAYCKAVCIDKFLLDLHQEFAAIHINSMDEDFLQKVSRSKSKPPTTGRVKHAGVFLVFALLEMFDFLGSMKHSEILDLCDEVGLNRYQNRIEDENALTKCLLRYRRYQKTGGVSMH